MVDPARSVFAARRRGLALGEPLQPIPGDQVVEPPEQRADHGPPQHPRRRPEPDRPQRVPNRLRSRAHKPVRVHRVHRPLQRLSRDPIGGRHRHVRAKVHHPHATASPVQPPQPRRAAGAQRAASVVQHRDGASQFAHAGCYEGPGLSGQSRFFASAISAAVTSASPSTTGLWPVAVPWSGTIRPVEGV